jgi:hypothetical protein
MLDGDHAFRHDYYFIGTSFLISYLAIKLLLNQKTWIRYFFIVCLIILNLEGSFYLIKPIWKNSYRKDAISIMQTVPGVQQERSIATNKENPPEIGLLFGKFQGKTRKSKYFIQFSNNKKRCSPIVKENKSFRICKNLQY